MKVVFLAFSLSALLLSGCGSGGSSGTGTATPTSDIPEKTSITATTVKGKAFSDSFKSNHGYVIVTEGQMLAIFGNGERQACNAVPTKEDTAFVSFSTPAKTGSYKAGEFAGAVYTTKTAGSRQFETVNIVISAVDASSVKGTLTLTSPDGTISGAFNIPVCR